MIKLVTQENQSDLDSVRRIPYLLDSLAVTTYRYYQNHTYMSLRQLILS